MLAGELLPGETVGVEVQLSNLGDPLRARATVRYQDKLRYGMEFVSLSAEQLESIRGSAKGSKAEGTVSSRVAGGKSEKGKPEKEKRAIRAGSEPEDVITDIADVELPPKHGKTKWIISLVAFVLLAAISGLLWWKWNRGWEELEAGLKRDQAATAERPQAQVPAEVMEKLLIHRVEPTYPVEARRANLQGVIALDIVVGRDGSVLSMRALNGPEVLVKAAMDALRWWKFEPYKVNGEPAVVETTVAVEFKR